MEFTPYWYRKHDSTVRIKLAINALGAISTAIALLIMIVEKFIAGAWVILIVAPSLVWLLRRINRHYKQVNLEVTHPLKLRISKIHSPIVIIPIQEWDKVAEKALHVGLLMSEDIIALHISSENDEEKQPLKELWTEMVEKPAQAAKIAIPELKIIHSSYRQIYKPILDFIQGIKKKNPDRLITIIIPEVIEAHWYQYFLHDVHAEGLRTLLFLDNDLQIVVIHSPWYLRDISDDKKFL